MNEDRKTLIMKFGGAAANGPESFAKMADTIVKQKKIFSKIAVVISAMSGMTDSLIELAKKVHPNPPKREYDMLVSSGERVSIALLAMALSLKGEEAVSFTGSQSGIITSSEHSEARIIQVRPERILSSFDTGKVVIVAGFQGVSLNKEITTLGRGGSDTTAVALGIALRAEKVEFYKDVEGVYEEDPKVKSGAEKYRSLDYERALEVIERTGGKILHPRALKLAAKNHLPLYVRSFFEEIEGTFIAAADKRKESPIYE